MKTRLILSGLFTLFVAAGFAGIASANSWSVLGYDGASIGKGGALTANAVGPSATYYNPAGLARSAHSHGTLSYLHGEPLLKLIPDANPDALNFQNFQVAEQGEIDTVCTSAAVNNEEGCRGDFERYNDYIVRGAAVNANYQRVNATLFDRAKNPSRLDGITLGLSSPLTHDAGSALAFGFSLFIPVDTVAHVRLRGPSAPYFLQYDDASDRIAVSLGAAIQMFDSLRLGASVEIIVDVNVKTDVNVLLPAELRLGSIANLDPNFSDIGSAAVGGLDLPLRYQPTVGIQYNPIDSLDFGVTYRDEQQINVNIDTLISIESAFGTREIPIGVKTQAWFNARELAGGVAWKANENWEVMADLTWKQWSRFKPEVAVELDIGTEQLADGVCDIVDTFSDLDDILEIAESLGSIDSTDLCPLIEDQIDELGLDDLEVYDVKANKLSDTLNPAVGVSYKKDPWGISAGYRYEQNPSKKQDGLFSIVDANTNVYSANVDFKVFDIVTLGIYGQYRQLKKTVIKKKRQKVANQNNNSDPFPDLNGESANGPGAEFETDADERFQTLANYVEGVQNLSAGNPGYTIKGGYLSVGLQISVEFLPPEIAF